jgi:hypothetical protein
MWEGCGKGGPRHAPQEGMAAPASVTVSVSDSRKGFPPTPKEPRPRTLHHAPPTSPPTSSRHHGLRGTTTVSPWPRGREQPPPPPAQRPDAATGADHAPTGLVEPGGLVKLLWPCCSQRAAVQTPAAGKPGPSLPRPRSGLPERRRQLPCRHQATQRYAARGGTPPPEHRQPRITAAGTTRDFPGDGDGRGQKGGGGARVGAPWNHPGGATRGRSVFLHMHLSFWHALSIAIPLLCDYGHIISHQSKQNNFVI